MASPPDRSSSMTTSTASSRPRRSASTSSAPAAAVRFARTPRREPSEVDHAPPRDAAVSSTSPTRASYRLRRALVAAGAVAATLAAGSASTPAQAAAPAPYSAHAMVYTCCTPHALKERMFSEAKAMGSSYIRLAVEIGPMFEAGRGWRQQAYWLGLDEVIALSRKYRLPVVGVLYDTPTPLSTCPTAPGPGKCPPTDYTRYGNLAGAIAGHARGVIRHWEVLNEPDGTGASGGSAGQYAWMLRRASDAIKSAA